MQQAQADLPTAMSIPRNRVTALDYLMVFFQPTGLWICLLFILKDKK